LDSGALTRLGSSIIHLSLTIAICFDATDDRQHVMAVAGGHGSIGTMPAHDNGRMLRPKFRNFGLVGKSASAANISAAR
jgi:hypothetical protein